MPFDAHTADQTRATLAAILADDPRPVEEKRMFGGLALMVGGHMCVGVIENKVVARIGPDAFLEAMTVPGIAPMDFTGRPMLGWVYLTSPIVEDPPQFAHWVSQATQFVATLGDKKPSKPRKRSSEHRR